MDVDQKTDSTTQFEFPLTSLWCTPKEARERERERERWEMHKGNREIRVMLWIVFIWFKSGQLVASCKHGNKD